MPRKKRANTLPKRLIKHISNCYIPFSEEGEGLEEVYSSKTSLEIQVSIVATSVRVSQPAIIVGTSASSFCHPSTIPFTSLVIHVQCRRVIATVQTRLAMHPFTTSAQMQATTLWLAFYDFCYFTFLPNYSHPLFNYLFTKFHPI